MGEGLFAGHLLVPPPPGSEPGPSGLRPSHLKECVRNAGASQAFWAGLSAFVKAAVRGALPAVLAPILCASNLIPLKKKDGGIRPIAVGDTLRRVVGKVLLRRRAVVAIGAAHGGGAVAGARTHREVGAGTGALGDAGGQDGPFPISGVFPGARHAYGNYAG